MPVIHHLFAIDWQVRERARLMAGSDDDVVSSYVLTGTICLSDSDGFGINE